VPGWLKPVGEENDIVNVHGALKGLEKWVPEAGLTLLHDFFPTRLGYEDGNVRDNEREKFWKRAWETKRVRRRAAQGQRWAKSELAQRA
jgi:hypothetical protein